MGAIMRGQVLRLLDVEAGRQEIPKDRAEVYATKVVGVLRALRDEEFPLPEELFMAILELAAVCIRDLESFPGDMAERLATKVMTCSRYNAAVEAHRFCGQCEGLDRACQRAEG